jgi:hypothetical protein
LLIFWDSQNNIGARARAQKEVWRGHIIRSLCIYAQIQKYSQFNTFLCWKRVLSFRRFLFILCLIKDEFLFKNSKRRKSASDTLFIASTESAKISAERKANGTPLSL